MEIQNCSIRSDLISKMAAILKFFKESPELKVGFELILDWRYQGDMEIQNCSVRFVSIAKMVAS